MSSNTSAPATAAATKVEEKSEKKSKKRKFPSISSFPSKVAYFDHMIKLFQDKKADFLKNGDGEKQKKVKKAQKLLEALGAMVNDPDYSEVLKDIRAKVTAPPAPAKR